MNGVHRATNTDAFAPSPASTKFWGVNAAFWSAYAVVLMIPWLDRYSFLQMLPNKVVISATGVAVTGTLRSVYRWLAKRSLPAALSIWGALIACLIGAFVFDATVITITQGPDAFTLRFDGSFGSIIDGVPMQGRIGQYAVLLVAWSLAHHLLTGRAIAAVVPATPVKSVEAANDAPLSISGSIVRVRDGSRTILLERDEIDWIAADGDYIRLYCGSKNLLIRATMKQSSGILSPLGFVRVHRSAIVNPRHVREIVRDGNDRTVVLRNGVRVRAGRNYVAGLDRINGVRPH